MKASQRRKLEKFEREEVFLQDNIADFPAASPGGKAFAELSAVITTIRTFAAEQSSGESSARQHVGVKDDEVDALRQMIRNINRAANAFEDEIPGSDLKFRLPRNRSEQNILATARAFLADAEPLKAKFVEYGLAIDFLDKLQALIEAVDERGAAADSSVENRAGATGGLVEAIRRGMSVSRRLDAIVRIKYENNAARRAAWTVASHLEQAPEKKKTEPAPPT
ncbi:MAG TPA: hypothetical protein VF604_17810 [Pyrinomonadaceae bacterium]|jgi:hypothetical protein